MDDLNFESSSFIEEEYKLFQERPISVGPSWQRFFTELSTPSEKITTATIETLPGITIELYSEKARAFWQTHSKHEAFSSQEQKEILQLLTKAEVFEHFLHTKFVGQKRFSLEGAETLIPMLFFLFEKGAQKGVEEVIVGMSHRGRLNVLAHIFQKPLTEIISEFRDQDLELLEGEGSGDVKYHKGHANIIETRRGRSLPLIMISNASHLESVDPVLTGYTRGRQTELNDTNYVKLLPLLIHGDAAISGQGVVYETLQLSKLKGYTIGGTIHIVVNNRIGFTTLPEDSRSTPNCTDIAKAFDATVLRVDANNPESCVRAALIAYMLRQALHEDVFIDLLSYRKYGHNEGDEPAFTQPLLYEEIRQKKSIADAYKLTLQNTDTSFSQDYRKTLDEAFASNPERRQNIQPTKSEKTVPIFTLSTERLMQLGVSISTVPASFTLHPRIKKTLETRLTELQKEKGNYLVDYNLAETLALATLLTSNIPVRFSGQDSRRGTFSQRHAVFFDQHNNNTYTPLEHLPEPQARFEIYDSPLSEFAVLGFEYGFSLAREKTQCFWEAQFGDFVNGAQVILDQYLAAGESKWGATSHIALLLPHGYEGQGPEHSSARLERFLQLSAEDNLIITNPTTPKQYFHLLLRQSQLKKPLITITPKGLLRDPRCRSKLEELATGKFEELLIDNPTNTSHVIFCQGRIYYEIADLKLKSTIVRFEQLHPFTDEMQQAITGLKQAKRFIWVQEEPMNSGAWSYMQPLLSNLLGAPILYIGREASASPATGSHDLHIKQHEAIILQLRKEVGT